MRMLPDRLSEQPRLRPPDSIVRLEQQGTSFAQTRVVSGMIDRAQRFHGIPDSLISSGPPLLGHHFPNQDSAYRGRLFKDTKYNVVPLCSGRQRMHNSFSKTVRKVIRRRRSVGCVTRAAERRKNSDPVGSHHARPCRTPMHLILSRGRPGSGSYFS